jgi:epoxyqueuosine reductase
MDKRSQLTQFIKSEALKLGFSHCGISAAGFLEEEAPRLESWLKEGYNGKMKYMENHFDKRLDPRLLVDGAKSVVSLLLNYFPSVSLHENEAPKVAKYAYGNDYHDVIGDKLKLLMSLIVEKTGDISGRVFVDSAPVLDKAWAKKSGLGWVGKNTNLLNKNAGSFFFIAELIIDVALDYDSEVQDYCGTCTRCIDACPTEAIIKPYVVDGSRCISYFTIELKEEIPQTFRNSMDDWVFGCDVCQDVCPWNRFSKPHSEKHLDPVVGMTGMNRQDWYELTEEVFQKRFGKTGLMRPGYNRIMRNLEFIRKPS